MAFYGVGILVCVLFGMIHGSVFVRASHRWGGALLFAILAWMGHTLLVNAPVRVEAEPRGLFVLVGPAVAYLFGLVLASLQDAGLREAHARKGLENAVLKLRVTQLENEKERLHWESQLKAHRAFLAAGGRPSMNDLMNDNNRGAAMELLSTNESEDPELGGALAGRSRDSHHTAKLGDGTPELGGALGGRSRDSYHTAKLGDGTCPATAPPPDHVLRKKVEGSGRTAAA